MFILAFAGMLQAVFLPGLALLSIGHNEKRHLNLFEILTFSFALSLIFNYLFVGTLTFFGLNSIYPQVLCLALEMGLFILFYVKNQPNFYRMIAHSSFIASALILGLLCAYTFVFQGNAIFSGADEIFSWGKWGLQWARDQLPTETRHYPQLMPIALSVVYEFIGNNEFDFFPKAIMPLFTLAIFGVFGAFYFLKRQIGYVFSILIFVYLIYSLSWGGRLILMAAGDVPVAFALFICYFAFTKWRFHPRDKVLFYLTALFAGMATVAKQGGLLIILFFLLYFLIERFAPPKNRLLTGADWLVFWLILLPITLSWYGYSEYQVRLGFNHYDRAETWIVNYGTTFYQTQTPLLDKLGDAFTMLVAPLRGWWVMGLFVLLSLYSLRDREHRGIILLMVVGYTAIWAFFVGYDYRNLIHSTPFYSLAIGLALGDLTRLFRSGFFKTLMDRFRRVGDWCGQRRKTLIRSGFAALLLFLWILDLKLPIEKIKAKVYTLKMQKVGDSPELNQELYKYFNPDHMDPSRKIAGYYDFMKVLPGVSTVYVPVDMKRDGAIDVVLKDSSIHYILLVFVLHWHTFINETNMREVQALIKKGTLKPLFMVKDGWLLEIHRKTP